MNTREACDAAVDAALTYEGLGIFVSIHGWQDRSDDIDTMLNVAGAADAQGFYARSGITATDLDAAETYTVMGYTSNTVELAIRTILGITGAPDDAVVDWEVEVVAVNAASGIVSAANVVIEPSPDTLQAVFTLFGPPPYGGDDNNWTTYDVVYEDGEGSHAFCGQQAFVTLRHTASIGGAVVAEATIQYQSFPVCY